MYFVFDFATAQEIMLRTYLTSLVKIKQIKENRHKHQDVEPLAYQGRLNYLTHKIFLHIRPNLSCKYHALNVSTIIFDLRNNGVGPVYDRVMLRVAS